MRIKKFAIVAGAALAALTLAACGHVEPGHVGIKVNKFAGGVQTEPLGVGYYFTPIGTKIYAYPIYTINYSWEGNESFNFQSAEGLGLSGAVSIAYSVDPIKASILFQKYRITMDQIVAGPLRNAVRNALVEQGALMKVDEIYGPRKTELINNVQAQVAKYFEPYGLHVEQIYWGGNIVVPQLVLTQINQKIANEQAALAAQANVATATANANARIAQATGEAQANSLLAASIKANPEIIQLKAVEGWSKAGAPMPTYWGGGPLPFINVK